MTGTFEGLSLPIFGEFYRYSEGGTQNLFVEDSGVFNLTVGYSGVAAENAFAVAYSPNGSVASGYGSGVYVNLAVSGTSTGSISTLQQNAFAADVSVNGTQTCGIGGLYIYLSKGTATLTSARIYGGYFDIGNDFGTVDYLSCIVLDKHNTTLGTTVDAFILCQLQGSGTASSLIRMQGGAKPVYFLDMSDGAAAGFLDTDSRASATSTNNIAVNIAGTTKYIQLLTAT
jgi:hypothetical protein